MGAAVEAVRRAGPDFSVDDVARSAGVSKTVIYRYFSDKDELVDAVLERISTGILLPRLLGELAAEHADDRAAAARGHRRLRLADRGRTGALPVRLRPRRPLGARTTWSPPPSGRSPRRSAVLMADRLAAAGRPADAAMTWAYGVVGMVQLAAHWWSTARTVPAEQLVEQLTDLADGGLGALLPPLVRGGALPR